jgi:hypothetical protein
VLTLTGVMIPVGVIMLIFVHFFHPHLNTSVYLLPSFLISVTLKMLIIDGASIDIHVKYYAQGTTKLHKSL